MGLTIVLSGTSGTRTQAVAALKQAGFSVEDNEHSHGFERDGDLTFITAHGSNLDAAQGAVSGLNWTLRSHWQETGSWQKVPSLGSAGPDPLEELAKLKAQLRSQNINVGE